MSTSPTTQCLCTPPIQLDTLSESVSHLVIKKEPPSALESPQRSAQHTPTQHSGHTHPSPATNDFPVPARSPGLALQCSPGSRIVPNHLATVSSPLRINHRWSFSPKDAIALQHFPTSARCTSGSALTSPHPHDLPSPRKQHPACSSPNPPRSGKRITWTPTSSQTPLKDSRPTPDQIAGIERLGVQFIDVLLSPTQTNHSAAPKLTPDHYPQTPLLVKPVARRNSVTKPRRRRSSKLLPNSPHPLPDNTPPGITPIPTSLDQLLQLLVASKPENDGPKQNLPPLLVIDLRSLNSYLGPHGRLKGSINVNFPSLLIKRFLKGTPSNFQLHPFITTEAGKRYYSRLEKTYRSNLAASNSSSPSSSVLEQLDICIIDDQLGNAPLADKPFHPGQQNSFGKVFLDLLGKWLGQKGRRTGLFYLIGPFEQVLQTPAAKKWLLFGEQADMTQLDGAHLPDLNTPLLNHGCTINSAPKPTHLPHSLPSSSTPHGLLSLQPSAPAPSLPFIHLDSTPTMASVASIISSSSNVIVSSDPSRKPKPPKLRRIDTSESILGSPRASSLTAHSKQPLTQLKTDPQTLSVSPLETSSCGAGKKPNLYDYNTRFSTQPFVTDPSKPGSDVTEQLGAQSSSNQHVGSQLTHPQFGIGNLEKTPSPSTQDLEMKFQVSTIIPSFLYLGPEPAKESDFQELKKLGIKVVLNVALECVKPEILEQEGYQFLEKYHQIPLRDYVEETGIRAGIQKSNQILDHAFLLQSPIYVHCKAGKSRSVTMVLAYLIHRYRWSLKQSYAHVSERRQGVCPNIGFLAELMNFEEQEIGSKSRGVTGTAITMGGRSASHHYSYSSHHNTPLKYDMEGEGRQESCEVEEEAGDGGRIGFHGYSFDGLGSTSHNPKSNPFDPRHHHGIRVRSVALGSKTDFFSSLAKPSLSHDDGHAQQDSSGKSTNHLTPDVHDQHEGVKDSNNTVTDD